MRLHNFFLAALPAVLIGASGQATDIRSPYQVVAEAPAEDWRALDVENTLYLDLPTGRVVIELVPNFAPKNVANVKALAREGFYDGLSVYRVVDGFVAQGGDESGVKPLKNAKRQVEAEFTRSGTGGLIFTRLAGADGYADETGFVNSHPVGREVSSGKAWLVHCPGAVTISRDEGPDSGGTDFAISLGHAPRYLDQNITMVGHVMYGMEHLQKLKRGEGAMGMVADAISSNGIKSAQVAVDIEPADRIDLEVLKSDSPSFKELMASRASRPESWFVKRHDYVDVCGVPVPVRARNKG